MAQSIFSTGNLWGIPAGTNVTPVRFGTLQDVSVDFSFDMKKLYGGFQFPVEQARGKGSIDIKATLGRVDPTLFNQVFFGLTNPTGEVLGSTDETTNIAATVTVANSATWSVDLGVYFVGLNKYLTRVASAPATGQYSVAAGVYTFASADVTTSGKVMISYTYASAATGSTITQSNTLLGSNVVLGLQLTEYFKGAAGGKSMSMNFKAVQCSKLNMPLKLDDFALPVLDMSAQDDGSGNVFTWTMTG